MKYKLNALDRIIIPNLLPREGSMLEQTTIKEIVELVKLKSADYDTYGIKERLNPMNPTLDKVLDPETLDSEKNPKILEEIEVDLSKSQTQVMKEAIDKLDKDKKITQFNLETCKKVKEMRG